MASKTTTTTDPDPPIPADDLKTEKEKAPASPAAKASEPEKAKTIEDHGIAPTDPYPTGSPPAPTYAEINGLTKPDAK